MWLSNTLLKQFLQLHVWLYRYNADLNDTVSIIDIFDNAENFRLQIHILRNKTKMSVSEHKL